MTVLSDKGFLHKSVVYEGGSHIIEEIQLLKNSQPIKTLLLSTKEVKLIELLYKFVLLLDYSSTAFIYI